MNSPSETTFEFAVPISVPWLVGILLLFAVVIAVSYRFTRSKTSPTVRCLTGILRWLACVAVLALALRPEKVERVETFPPGKVAVITDTSRSMAIDDENGSRLDAAKEWIGRYLSELPSTHEAVWFGASTNLYSVSGIDELEATGSESRLSDSLDTLLDNSVVSGLHSVILLSDGAETPPSRLNSLGDRLQTRDLPLFAMALGDAALRGDVSIESVRLSAPGVSHQTLPVDVALQLEGIEETSVELVVSSKDGELERRAIDLGEGQETISLELGPLASGFQTLTFEIPALSGEPQEHDNRYEVGLNIIDEVVRVLYMEASGVQQGIFQPLILKEALDSVPDVEAKTLYTDQYGGSPLVRNRVAYIDPKSGERIYRVQHDAEGFPKTMEDLLKWDVIINSDIPVATFTREQLELTSEFVTEHGGGFIMVGGETAFGSGGYHRTVIDQLIPVVMEDFDATLRDNFTPEVPEESWGHPLLQVVDDPQANRAAWTRHFPPLLGFNVVVKEKPGATILLKHPTRTNENGPLILLAGQEVGAGRSMALTWDTTFLWGMYFQERWGPSVTGPGVESNDYYRQFWANAVRWLSANKKRAERTDLRLEPVEGWATPGAALPIRVAVGAELESGSSRKVRVELWSADGTMVVSQDALWNPEERVFATTVTTPDEGRYRMRVHDPESENPPIERLLISERRDWETLQIRAEPDALRQLAEASGGRLLERDSLSREELLDLMVGGVEPIVRESRFPIGGPGFWAAIIIALLSLEWILRRMNRMV